MRALISQRQIIDKYGVECDQLESSYVEFFGSLGFESMPVSNFSNNRWWEKFEFDLLVLSGGGSVPNGFYNRTINKEEFSRRDIIESHLLEYAISKNIPVIGICRGMQFINGYFGGEVDKLTDLKQQRTIGIDHRIELDGNSILVNNYHNDGILVKNLSKSFMAIGIDTDNEIVECYISKEINILGIQWHPERLFTSHISNELSTNLIKGFLFSRLNE